VHASRQLVLTLVLVAGVAVAAVVANLALLRTAQNSSDPVGRLSPRAVFSTQAPTTSTTPANTTSSDDGRGRHSGEPDD